MAPDTSGSDERQVPLGRTVMTQTAAQAIERGDVLQALARHERGDWGDVCAEDGKANDLALVEGERLLSVYRSSSGVRFWVITEWDRSVTTVLLPADY